MALAAVSYTHLDVYKRQPAQRLPEPGRVCDVHGPAAFSGGRVPGKRPVQLPPG